MKLLKCSVSVTIYTKEVKLGRHQWQYLSGLEYRLVWLCDPGPGAGGAGAGAGVDSLDAAFTQLSTTPNSGIADSEPKSRAPNWRFRPGTSAEPGISTAVEGICKEGGTQSCFRTMVLYLCMLIMK